MAVTAAELKVVISAQNQATAQIEKLSATLGNLGNAAKGAAPGFGTLTAAFTAANVAAGGIIRTIGGVTGALTGGLKASTDFGQSMSSINAALPAGQFQQFGSQLSDLALQLGKDLPISAGDAAGGIEALAKKGLSAQDILGGAGKAAALLASATGEDLTTGANVAGAALNVFNLSADKMVSATDHIVGAIQRGGGSAQGFGQFMAQAGQTTKAFGQTLDDLALSYAASAKAGFQASDAGTSYKTLLTNLLPQTKQAADEQKTLGLITADGSSKFVDAQGNIKSYIEVGALLADATKNMSAAGREQAFTTAFGTDAQRAANVAVDAATGKLGDLTQVLNTSAEAVAKIKMDNLAGDMENLEGSVQTLAVSLGQKLDPAFRGIAQAANQGVGALIDSVKGLDFSGIVDPIKKAFDDAGAFIKAGGSIPDAVRGLLGTLNAFAADMFGAGYTLVTTFAQGMLDAIGGVLNAAAEAVASAIASFLVGSSPPPKGPLSKIDEDGRNLIETYASQMGQASLGPIEDVAARMQGMLTDFKGLGSLGEDVAGQIRLISDAIDDIGQKSADLKFQIDDIKAGYEDQIQPLKDQLDAIDNVNDSLSKQQDILDELAGLNLKQAEIAAKGDPSKRADIKGKQEENRFAQEDIQNQIRSLELDNKKGSNDKAIAALKAKLIGLNKDELDLKRQEAGLTDKTALAEIEKQKTQLSLSKETRQIDERKAQLQRDLLKLPIQQQIKDIERAQRDQLKPLEAQMKIYDRQRAALEEQRRQWQKLDGDIKRATEAAKPEPAKAAKAATAGAGGFVKLPSGTGGAGLDKALGASITAAADNAKEQALIAGQQVATNVAAGIKAWFAANGPAIIGGALGAAIGGLTLGPLGALLGGTLGAEIGAKLQEKIPNLGDVLKEKFGDLQSFFQSDIVPPLQAFGDALQKDVLPRLQDFGSTLRTDVLPRLGDFKDAAVGAWQDASGAVSDAWRTMQPQIQGLADRLAAFATEVEPDFSKAMDNIVNAYSRALDLMSGKTVSQQADVQGLWREHGSTLQSIFDGTVKVLTDQLNAMFAAWGVIIRFALKLLAGDWQGGLDVLTATLGTWRDGALAIWTEYNDGVNKLLAALKAGAEQVGKDLKAMFAPDGIFGQAAAEAVQIGTSVVQGLQQGISDALGGFKRWVTDNLANALPQWVRDVLGIHSPSTVFADIGHQMIAGLEQGMSDRIKSLDIATIVGRLKDEFMNASGGGVTAWLSAALALTNTSFDWLPGLRKLVDIESSGNPSAVNSIAVNGEHATGLLQTLPSTFRSYAMNGFGDILNPIHNAIAAIRYIKATYGSVYDIPHTGDENYQGYAKGGPVLRTERALVHAGEYVVPRGGALVGAGGTTIVLQGPVYGFDDFQSKVAQAYGQITVRHERERSRNMR